MEAAMMGEKLGLQGQFFYKFNLEERVPQDHLLRQIDAVLDLSDLRAKLSPYYSYTGRPSIDPDATGWLLLWYSLGASAVRRG